MQKQNSSPTVFDDGKVRAGISLLIFIARLSFSIILALLLPAQFFEDVFASVSLVSSFLIILSAANVNVKGSVLLDRELFSVSDLKNYLLFFEVVIGAVFVIVGLLDEPIMLALIIAGSRFIGSLRELGWELENRHYALRFPLAAEFFICLIFFAYFQELLIYKLILSYFMIVFVVFLRRGGSIKRCLEIVKVYGLRKEGVFLESYGVVFFGLELFIMSYFLSPTQFVMYFFVQRIFNSLNLLHGMTTKNIWSQAVSGGEPAEKQAAVQNKRALTAVLLVGVIVALAIAIILAFIPAFDWIATHVFNIDALLLDLEFLVICLLVNVVNFAVVSCNRYEKNRFSARNQLFNLATPSALLALAYALVVSVLLLESELWLVAMAARTVFLVLTVFVYRRLYSLIQTSRSDEVSSY